MCVISDVVSHRFHHQRVDLGGYISFTFNLWQMLFRGISDSRSDSIIVQRKTCFNRLYFVGLVYIFCLSVAGTFR